MKPSVNNVTSNQPKMLSNREAKKSVNRKSHGILFFQVGLILSLIASIFAMEINVGSPGSYKIKENPGIEEPPMVTYVIEKPKPKSEPIAKVIKARPKVKVIKDIVKVVKNTKPVESDPVITKAAPIVAPKKKAVVRLDPPVDTNKTRNLNQVEFVPVFPGCESLATNDEKKACMNSKINAFISKKFQSDRIAGLKRNETHTIYVQFTIGRDGEVHDVVARAASKQMQKEGVRVLSKLPKMIPGRMGTLHVPVSYLVPIKFNVE